MPISQKIGWRSYVSPLSSLLTSIYGVWNADTASTVTTLGNGTFAAWNAEDVITATQLGTNVSSVWNGEALGTSLDTSIHRVYNGDNVNDTSGNAQNGTNVGGVTFTTGKIGNAFTFNGSNYVSLPNNSLNLTGDFSISLWMMRKSAGQFKIFSNLWNGATPYGWILQISNGVLRCVLGNGTSTLVAFLESSSALSADVFHLITITKSNTSLKMYIDGSLNSSTTYTNGTVVYAATHYPMIGAWKYDNDSPLGFMENGSKIDAVNVWNKELTAGEITSLYNSGNGAEYPFSTQSLATYNDAVGTNHGISPSSTLTGGVPGPSFTTGKIGKAFSFDGVNDYIALPDNSLNFTGDFSYSFWIKSTNTSSFTAIISNIENARSPFGFSHGYWYRLNSGKIQASYRDGNNSTEFLTTSVGSVSNGSWNHVVITFNKTNYTTGVKIYINGNIDTTGIPPNTGGTALPIGYSSPMKPCIGALYFNGAQSNFLPNGTSIDALSAWNKELSASEISALYNSGNAQQYPFSDVTLSGVTSDALGSYNGTNNGVTFTTGKTGTSAFSFNGSSNYIALPQAALNFNKGNSGQSIGDFSVSFWLNLNTGSSDYQTVIGNWGDNGRGWQVVMFGGGFTFFGSDGSYGSTARIQHSLGLSKSNAINQWVHVVVTYTNQSQVKSYVNGVLTNTTSTTYQIRTNERNNGNLGCYPQSGDNSSTKYWFLNGKLDAVTLWTKALTNIEASALYNNGTGLQYSFPSSATGYLSSYNDVIGTNHGTLTNGCTFTTGKIGQAFTFDGVNDYVALPNNIMKFSNTDNWSISFWIYANVTGYSFVIGNNDYIGGQGTGWGIRTWTSGSDPSKFSIQLFTNWINGSGTPLNILQTDGTTSINTWNHFVITRNSSAQEKIYQNGTLVASQTNSSTKLIYPATSYSCIGANRYQSNIEAYAKAGSKIDAMSVWNKELTAEEVTNLYNSGNGKQYPNY